jgi:hypothetical protein
MPGQEILQSFPFSVLEKRRPDLFLEYSKKISVLEMLCFSKLQYLLEPNTSKKFELAYIFTNRGIMRKLTIFGCQRHP